MMFDVRSHQYKCFFLSLILLFSTLTNAREVIIEDIDEYISPGYGGGYETTIIESKSSRKAPSTAAFIAAGVILTVLVGGVVVVAATSKSDACGGFMAGAAAGTLAGVALAEADDEVTVRHVHRGRPPASVIKTRRVTIKD